MISVNYLFENNNQKQVHLKPFDYSYYKSLKDKDKIIYNSSKENIFYTIYCSNYKCGIIGLIKGKFLQILIEPKFRGQDVFKEALNLLVEKHKLNIIYSTIEKDNIIFQYEDQ